MGVAQRSRASAAAGAALRDDHDGVAGCAVSDRAQQGEEASSFARSIAEAGRDAPQDRPRSLGPSRKGPEAMKLASWAPPASLRRFTASANADL